VRVELEQIEPAIIYLAAPRQTHRGHARARDRRRAVVGSF